MNLFLTWFSSAILYGTVILYGAMGEIITEKAGHLNLGTPGIMVFGGAFGFLSGFLYENSCTAAGTEPNAFLMLTLTLLVSFLAGVIAGGIYSFLTITLRANQNVTGLTLTTFAVGMAKFMAAYFIPEGQVSIRATVASRLYAAHIPGLSDIPVVGKLFFSYGFMVYLAVILAIGMMLILNKTRVGLNLRAIGESPATADAAGIPVTKYKYLAIAVGSGISGLGGAFYLLDINNGGWSTQTGSELQGFGWLAVALVIFAVWKSVQAIWGAYLFGLCYWAYQYLPALLNIRVSTDLARMLPYVVTIIVLILISLRKKRENQAPAALGLSYFREDR